MAFERDRLLLEAGRGDEFQAHHAGVLAAMHSIEEIQRKRDWIQAHRRVDDEALLRFFPEPFRIWAYAEPHYTLFAQGEYEQFRDECLDRFEVRSLFGPCEGHS